MFERLFASKKRHSIKQAAEWDTVKLDLSGCEIEVTLPPSDFFVTKVEDGGKKFNLFDATGYQYPESPVDGRKDMRKTGEFTRFPIYRPWESYGFVWKISTIGQLFCSLVIGETSKLGQQFNCFNRQHFEYLARYDAYFSVGPGAGFKIHECPVNWHVVNITGTEWIYFEGISRDAFSSFPSDIDIVSHYVWLMTPIFADKYLRFTFRFRGCRPLVANNQCIMKRIQRVMDSVSVSLAPDGKKQQSEVSSTPYSEQRAPEDWSYQSYEEVDGDLQINNECSPPPKFGQEIKG